LYPTRFVRLEALYGISCSAELFMTARCETMLTLRCEMFDVVVPMSCHRHSFKLTIFRFKNLHFNNLKCGKSKILQPPSHHGFLVLW
jgi:hypothetical protein